MKTATSSQATWEVLQQVIARYRAQYLRVAGELELSPAQVHALLSLQPDRPVTMNDIASNLTCDPSNVTGLVDRMEARGWMRRETAPEDRRSKIITLTPEGKRLRERIKRRLATPPKELAALSEADQADLRRVLQALLQQT